MNKKYFVNRLYLSCVCFCEDNFMNLLIVLGEPLNLKELCEKV